MNEFEKYHKQVNGLLPEEETTNITYNGELGETWKNLKKISETDPELKQQLIDTELESIKSGQHFRNQDGLYENEFGRVIKGIEVYEERKKIRKAASKYITDRDQLNRFVTSRDYKTFKKNLNKPKNTPTVIGSSIDDILKNKIIKHSDIEMTMEQICKTEIPFVDLKQAIQNKQISKYSINKALDRVRARYDA